MLYYLHNFSEFFGPLRLFEYISFRAGGAFFAAFLLTVFTIPPLLPFYQKYCIQKSSRTDDGKKPCKPLMGGVVIIGAVVFSALLWGMISDRADSTNLFPSYRRQPDIFNGSAAPSLREKRDSGQPDNHSLLDRRHYFCPDRPCHSEDTIAKKAAG